MMDKIELIDKAALLEMLPQICDELNGCSAPYNFDEHCVGCEVYMLHKMLTDMPTIDAQPVRRGEWIELNTMFKGVCQCSACGTYIGMSTRALTEKRKDFYCSECGADMRSMRNPINGEVIE